MPTEAVVANLEILRCGHVESGDSTNTFINLQKKKLILKQNNRWNFFASQLTLDT